MFGNRYKTVIEARRLPDLAIENAIICFSPPWKHSGGTKILSQILPIWHPKNWFYVGIETTFKVFGDEKSLISLQGMVFA